MKEFIEKLLKGKSLRQGEMSEIFSRFAEFNVEQKAAFLVLLQQKGESVAEILGARNALIKASTLIPNQHDAIDIVGTGGDSKGTFNISTAASLILASCKVKVAKHGSRAQTSVTGSLDVAEKLGIPIPKTIEEAAMQLKAHNYAYLGGALFNQQLKEVASLRRNLGIPLIFNILGPLLNPVEPTRMVMGVFNLMLVNVVAKVMQKLKLKDAFVVHGHSGIDEFSLTGPSIYAELRAGKIYRGELNLAEVGLKPCRLSSLVGGNVNENVLLLKKILYGEIEGPKLDIVLLNVAAGLLVSKKVTSFKEGVEVAKNAVLSGQTKEFYLSLRGS